MRVISVRVILGLGLGLELELELGLELGYKSIMSRHRQHSMSHHARQGLMGHDSSIPCHVMWG